MTEQIIKETPWLIAIGEWTIPRFPSTFDMDKSGKIHLKISKKLPSLKVIC